jgi:hypothetical protein
MKNSMGNPIADQMVKQKMGAEHRLQTSALTLPESRR